MNFYILVSVLYMFMRNIIFWKLIICIIFQSNQTLGDAATAYVFALIMCLFVEMPISALQKFLVPRLEQERKQERDIKQKFQ